MQRRPPREPHNELAHGSWPKMRSARIGDPESVPLFPRGPSFLLKLVLKVKGEGSNHPAGLQSNTERITEHRKWGKRDVSAVKSTDSSYRNEGSVPSSHTGL